MGKRSSNSMIFNLLAKKEKDLWIGHCLELDIVATADSLEVLKKDLTDLIIVQVDYAFSNNNLENLYHPAPSEVWEEFFKCRPETEEEIEVHSEFQDDRPLKSFVPPWIIAKTCLYGESCIA
jgi:hypothetical protein